MGVNIQAKVVEVSGYNKLVFSTPDGRWIATFKESAIREFGELMIKRSIKGQDYMTKAVNAVMEKLKFVPYKNKSKYDPRHFKDVEELILAIINKVKELTEFDKKAKVKQQKLGAVEPKEKEVITPV